MREAIQRFAACVKRFDALLLGKKSLINNKCCG